jgi:hypothetical protein
MPQNRIWKISTIFKIDVRTIDDEYKYRDLHGSQLLRTKGIALHFNRDHRFSVAASRKEVAGQRKITATSSRYLSGRIRWINHPSTAFNFEKRAHKMSTVCLLHLKETNLFY